MATKTATEPNFRPVGRRKGGKQLLHTSAGLVRTVVRNELIVHCAMPSSGCIRSSLEPSFGVLRTSELRCKCGAFSMYVLRKPENSMPEELYRTREKSLSRKPPLNHAILAFACMRFYLDRCGQDTAKYHIQF
jgi:hypothetical protein